MATRGFLPVRDLGLLQWGQNFYAVANPIATELGFTPGELTAFNALVTGFQTALAACDPGVRNKAAVMTKNQAAADLRANARLLANIVNGQATVTDAQKISLGLTVRAHPSPIGPPTDAPQVDIVSVAGRTVTIRLHDSAVAGKRGRPAGVKGASVWSYTGPTAPTDPSLYKFEGNTSKAVATIAFPDSAVPGTTVWISAQWFNERQQTSPGATPVSAVIQYGATMAS